MDWSDHPDKDQKWYETRRAKAVADGLLHVFAQEVERDYAAAVENVIIPANWIRSAIDAHIKLGFDVEGRLFGGLDVADEGGDRNAVTIRKGPLLLETKDWADGDTGQTTRRAIQLCRDHGAVELQYDSVGIGAGVKAESNRLEAEGLMPKGTRLIAWSAGAKVLNPDKHVVPGDKDTPLNKDFYANLKAQGWWQLRLRFERTHRAVTEGVEFPPDDLITLPSTLPSLRQIQKELGQATASTTTGSMKLVVNKSPEGTRSPNLADSIVMAFWPAVSQRYTLDYL